VTTRPDAIDRLSTAVRYQIANGLGWSGLRPVQALSTEAILDGANCVVLAPTAGGKTEAGFLPLLSKMDIEDWRGVSVLYVAPIRALLNNQEARLSKLTGLIGRRAGKWHGDVKGPTRKRLIDDPPDVLAITPESLEAMLLSTRTPARRFLAHVRAVVIDEVHAFAGDDRGAHLVSLLERIARIAETDIQRIGLSATVGDPEVIVRWLSGSSMRPQRIVDPGGARKPPELHLDFVGSLGNAVLLIDKLYAVFSTPRVLRVMRGHSEVGVIDASFLQDKEQRGPNFVLAGRAWCIIGADWKGGTCAVEPAEEGSYPRWFGLPVNLERSLSQAMRRILTSEESDPSWSKRAVSQIQLQRETHAFLGESSAPIEEGSDGRCRWWTFGGGAGNRVLAGLLELKLGERVSFSNGAAASIVAIHKAIDLLAVRSLTWEDATRLVDPNQRSRVSKFQPCLPTTIEHGLIARETMNVEDANAIIAQWKQGTKSQEGDA
jgi:Lhr-like helicase